MLKRLQIIIQNLILCIIIIFLFACENASIKTNSKLDNITDTIKTVSVPDGAIPIVYCGYILIPCVVDNVKGNFILDTGTDALHLDSGFFCENAFNYKTFKKVKMWGVGNSFQHAIEIIDSVSFQLKKYNYKTSNVFVNSIRPTAGDFFDGLIGLNNFKNKVLYVNYVHEYFNLYENLDTVNISDYNLIQLKKINDQLFMPIKIKINNKITIQGDFMVDLGSPTSVISSTIAKKYNFNELITSKVEYFTKFGGIGGYSTGFDFLTDSIKIASFNLQNVPFSYSNDTSGLMANDNFMGIIGNDILDRFDLLIDLKNNNLYLKSNANYKIPYKFDNSGFFVVDRNKTMGGFIVTGLFKNSPAEKQGLQADDKIIFVNNISVKNMSYKSFNNFFKNEDNVKLIVIRSGKIVYIKFKIMTLLNKTPDA